LDILTFVDAAEVKIKLIQSGKINWLKLQSPLNKAEISKFWKNHLCTP